MKKVSALLGALFAVSLSASPALAQVTERGTVAVTVTTAKPRAVLPAAQKAESLNEIFSTFSTDDSALYDCCTGWSLDSKDSPWGMQYIAVPFTPTADTHIRKIVIGASHLGGVNRMSVSLSADKGGLPGKALGDFKVTDLTTLGSCCETATVRAKGIPVTAGTQYWVVAKPLQDMTGAWNYNVIGATGNFAGRHDTGWYLDNGTLPAIRILAD